MRLDNAGDNAIVIAVSIAGRLLATIITYFTFVNALDDRFFVSIIFLGFRGNLKLPHEFLSALRWRAGMGDVLP